MLRSRNPQDSVIVALTRLGVDSFLQPPHATGIKLGCSTGPPRSRTQEAVLDLAPLIADDCPEQLVNGLGSCAGFCERRPCFGLMVRAVEKALW